MQFSAKLINIHHHHMELLYDIPRVVAQFYDIPGSERSFTTNPGRNAVLRRIRV